MPLATQDIPATSTPRLPVRQLHTVQQFCNMHPAFTPGGMRWLLFQREQNGLARAIVHIGRRLLIDEEKFFAWLEEQQKGTK
jgi:hypothetical protein